MCELGWELFGRTPDSVGPEVGFPLYIPEGEWPEFDFGSLDDSEDEEEGEDYSDLEVA